MSGGIVLPGPVAKDKVASAQQSAALGQLRRDFAKGTHAVLLARATDAAIDKRPDEIATDAVVHADALMRALFPGFRVGKAEES